MKLRNLSWLPAVLIMLIIFSFSAKPAIVSGENSLNIANYVMTIYGKITDTQVEEELRMDRLLVLDHYIRKSAHFMEYSILAAAYSLPLFVYGFRRRKLWSWSVLMTAVYAASDEFHQTFVPGRSGELRDVLLDTSGAAVGAVIFVVIAAYLDRKKSTGKARLKSE